MSPEKARLVTLAEDVHAFVGAGGDSNAGAVETPEGYLVIDAQQSVPLARRFRSELEALSRKPFPWLILTHYHLDHTGGGIVFAGDTPVLAHEITLAKFRELFGPDGGAGETVTDFGKRIAHLFGPNISELIPPGDPAWDWFKGRIAAPEYDAVVPIPPRHTFADQFTFHFPKRRVVLQYWGPAHCDGDIVVHLPDDGIVFVGDLLFVGRFPWLGDGDIGGWIDCLERVARLDARTVVPGHGKPATMNEINNLRDMLAALRGGVADARKKGMSEEEAARNVSLRDYESLPRYREWMPWNVRNVYRMLAAG
ncbi:MAG: MBL fold metallo-hydrolase [Candidatus Tectomicrobia bacterium]|uniref:MBL fold metallo-hydrolase n=1 Tax=Tectimicrobiota bacterium TaxID=2528274 RepID=A0A932HXN0_UNCTE|nr:MBL fold metallo-hydrolase [Candidatus Tectomicrobia bacterium]